MTAYEIPLSAVDQRFNIPLGGVTYQFTVKWCAPAAAWTLDIADEGGTALISGIPIVTGIDLLEQYQHIGIAGQIVAQTDGDTFAVPTQSNLGIAGHLYFIPTDTASVAASSSAYEAPATPGFNALSALGALSPDAGAVIFGNGTTWITKSGAILSDIAALSTSGIITRTGSGTATTRTIIATTNGGIAVANGDGVSGNPAVALGNYLPSATGAAARSVVGKIDERVSVWDFGTLGTADDTSVFQAAINWTSANGKTLWVPSGTYLVSALTWAPSDYSSALRIIGDGRHKTTIQNISGSTSAIVTIGSPTSTIYAPNPYIADISISATSASVPTCLKAYNMVYGIFDRCEFNGGDCCLQIWGGVSNNFRFCEAFGGNIGVYVNKFTSPSGDQYPNFNVFYAGAIKDNATHGVYFDSGRHLHLLDVDIETNGTNGNLTTGGVYQDTHIGSEGSLPTSIGIVMERCWLEGNAGNAAVSQNSGMISISDCVFIANANAVNDIIINGGNYYIERCDFDTAKTANLLESASTAGNLISFSKIPAKTIIAANTRVIDHEKNLSRGGDTLVSQASRQLVQSGADYTASGVVTITLPVSFASSSYNVLITMVDNDTTTVVSPEVYSQTASQFTVRKKALVSGSSTVTTSNTGFCWMAVGTAV